MQIKINKALLTISCLLPCIITSNTLAETKVIYPLQQISSLECRFQKFSELSDGCKIDLPILRTSDYKKYLREDAGYNLYTRTYTVLWGSSYKYGWDVGNGGHAGTDIATAEGTPVYAIADGKVIVADNLLGWGNTISIEHEINGKTVVSNYTHLSKILVKSGDDVKVGDEIGRVGSTGNASGNHLHFQIDLKYKFHPYYYDYSSCPYSYSKISESDICFPQLAEHTIDPLLFLETQGGILDNIEIKTEKMDGNFQQTIPPDESTDTEDIDIFKVTVYRESPTSYIRQVQKVMKDLGIYKGDLSGDYKDIEDDILAYQLSRSIIASASDTGAGYWGPKTRTQAHQEYLALSSNPGFTTKLSSITETVVRDFSKVTEKIDRTNILTREQIEEREINDFLKQNTVEVISDNIGGNLKVGESKTFSLHITDRKGRGFRGNMPGEINFSVDSSILEVFPKKFYYFTDGKRDIKITGLKAGITDLKVNIGQKTIKTLSINVYGEGTKIDPVGGKFIINSSVVMGETKTASFRFKDKSGRDIVNLKFDGKYKLASDKNTLFCIKKGNINDLDKIIKKVCKKEDYMTAREFTYNDTIQGVLIFDYIVSGKGTKITLSNSTNNLAIATKSISTQIPKGLKSDYDYYKDVVAMLQNGIASGVNQGYFKQNDSLKEKDAKDWIINALRYMKKNTSSDTFRKSINDRLALIKAEQVSDFNTLSREEFLVKAYQYLVFNNEASVSIRYKDLDIDTNRKANTIFNKEVTWKDQFGQSYFRPDKEITRGEATYLLSTLLGKRAEPLVTTIK